MSGRRSRTKLRSQNRFAERYAYGLPILSLCHKYGAKFQSFWTLSANPDLLTSPHLEAFAPTLSPEQALYAFLISTTRFGRGTIIPLNGTKSQKHMVEDLEVLKLVEGDFASSTSSRRARAALELELWG